MDDGPFRDVFPIEILLKAMWLVGGFNPSEKIWLRQLGWWHSRYMENVKMFQTTNQLCSFTGNVPQKNHGLLNSTTSNRSIPLRTSDFCRFMWSSHTSFGWTKQGGLTEPFASLLPLISRYMSNSQPHPPCLKLTSFYIILHHEVWNGWTSY